jgi:gliding motility-associated-like protein
MQRLYSYTFFLKELLPVFLFSIYGMCAMRSCSHPANDGINDNINDSISINDVFMPGKNIVIFDRLGVVIFEGDNGWDGTYNGKDAPPDVYFYKLTYTENGVSKEVIGYIGIAPK